MLESINSRCCGDDRVEQGVASKTGVLDRADLGLEQVLRASFILEAKEVTHPDRVVSIVRV